MMKNNYITDNEIKNFGLNVKKKVINNGFKLSENMITIVIAKVNNTIDVNEQVKLNKLVTEICGKEKFVGNKGFDCTNRSHVRKLKTILMKENAFSGFLGKALLDFYKIKPERTIIFEDNENTGRIIKEKTNISFGESFLYFIPVYNSKDQYVVDDDIKKYNNIAKNDYDIINGRFIC